MLKFNDYLKEAKLSAKQKKIAKLAGDEDKIDSDDLKALRAGAKLECKEESFKPEIADKFPASGVKTHEPKGKYSTMPKDREKAKGMPANKMSEEVELDEGRMKDIYYDMQDHATKKGYKGKNDFTKADYEVIGKKHGVSGADIAIVAGHHTADSYSKLKEAVDTVKKDASGKVTSWSHESDWKKADKKNPEGKVHNLAGIALKKTKELAKEEAEQIDELSKKTLGSYINKAAHDSRMQGHIATDFENMADRARKQSKADSYERLNRKYLAKAWKREAGIDKAVGKLTKEAKDGWSDNDSLAKPISSNQAMAQHSQYFNKVTKLDPKTGEPMKKKDVKEEVSQEMSPYVKGTLAVMDEGKIDNLRDAQKLRQDTMSAYDKDYKPDTSHPHIKVVKGTAYGGENQKDDENDEKPDETKEKRGRGRPAGSKSGARV